MEAHRFARVDLGQRFDQRIRAVQAPAVDFQQHIGSSDALRTGSYAKTLTFTLSTTAP